MLSLPNQLAIVFDKYESRPLSKAVYPPRHFYSSATTGKGVNVVK